MTIFTTYISVDPRHYGTFRAKVGKGDIIDSFPPYFLLQSNKRTRIIPVNYGTQNKCQTNLFLFKEKMCTQNVEPVFKPIKVALCLNAHTFVDVDW